MITKTWMDDLVRLQKLFVATHEENRFCSVHNDGVHILPQTFVELMQVDDFTVTVEDRKDTLLPLELTVQYQGTPFYALFSWQEVHDAGFEEYIPEPLVATYAQFLANDRSALAALVGK